MTLTAGLRACVGIVLLLGSAVGGMPPVATEASSKSPETNGPAASLSRARAAVLRAAVARVAPSIVMIETIGGAQPVGSPHTTTAPTTQRRPRFGDNPGFRVADGPTTGTVWSRDGLIVSSSFNFVRDPTVITVVLHDGRRFVARLLGRDYIRRLALLKIDATGLPLPEWADLSGIRVGQDAVAAGRGFGGTAPSVSVGIVSALRRRGGNCVQTDAKLSPANYGGPLIDLDGRVLGLIVPLAGAGGELAGVEWYDSGIGFAVVRERIALVIDRLAKGEDVEAGKMGVVLRETQLDPDDEASPARTTIERVARPSPANQAGLRTGDVIEKLNGEPVAGVSDLQRRISDLEAGSEITLSILRDEAKVEIKLKLARPDEIGSIERPQEAPTTAPSTQPAS